MRLRPYSIVAISASAALGAVVFAAACQSYKPYVDPDTVHYDAAVDYALAPQVTHIGPNAVTCCIEALGSGAAFYLVNPTPGGTDRRGNPKPPQGELHLATPYGVDYTLGTGVVAFGYGFSPDESTAFFLTPAHDTNATFALNAIRLTLPDLKNPTPKVVIAAGFDSGNTLAGDGFYTPTGNYFVSFTHGGDAQSTYDMHIVSVLGAEDVIDLTDGQGSGVEDVTTNDVMVYEGDQPQHTPGIPGVRGLYLLNLQAGQSGAPGKLIDTHVGTFQFTADSRTLVYIRLNGDLVLWDLVDQDLVTLASNVVSYSTGPGRRGPFVWVQKDLSVHVAFKERPEIVTLPANSIDQQSPILFSDNGQHLYFFKNLSLLSNYGDLYHVALPPTGNGQPNLVSVRTSLGDVSFTNGRMLYLRNIDNTGDTGELISAQFDGSDPQVMAPGVATGDVQIAYPLPYMPVAPKPGGFYPGAHAPDLSVVTVPAVLANLANATRDTSASLQFVNTSSRPVLGSLVYGQEIGQPELLVAGMVHVGQFQFSDDGYVLLYVSDAQYQSKAFNYVGKLQLAQTNNNIGPVVPMLEGVSEMGPISNRGVFVAAPGAATPGTYFVKF